MFYMLLNLMAILAGEWQWKDAEWQ